MSKSTLGPMSESTLGPISEGTLGPVNEENQGANRINVPLSHMCTPLKVIVRRGNLSPIPHPSTAN